VLRLVGLQRAFYSRVADLLDVRAGEDVLDLGCGTGILLEQLVKRQPAARYLGVDPDAAVLGVAARKQARPGSSVELVRAYAQALPFGARSFDAVVTTLVFHHLQDPLKRAALQEVRRVLRPSGRFLLVDFGRPTSRTAKALLNAARLFHGPRTMRANVAGDLPAMLEAAGFTGVSERRRPKWGIHYLGASPG
jgi:ubiquinone/menaquinone biosynthesis C-methylase UbiE